MPDDEKTAVYRILDANINRLREALRVIEEHFRFYAGKPGITLELKQIRHSLEEVTLLLGDKNLVASRDTSTDPLADETRPEELKRYSMDDILVSNLKRAQEAARVLEEYSKLVGAPSCPEMAKQLRFRIYNLEKNIAEQKS
jgi:thiamine-phosphate pyrophosphorylase